MSSCRSSSNAAVPVGTFDALHLQRATARRAVDMERHGGGRRVLGNPAAAERLVAFVAHACKGRFSILPIELCIRSQSAAFSIAIVFVSPACIRSSRFADTAKFVAACHCLSCLPNCAYCIQTSLYYTFVRVKIIKIGVQVTSKANNLKWRLRPAHRSSANVVHPVD